MKLPNDLVGSCAWSLPKFAYRVLLLMYEAFMHGEP